MNDHDPGDERTVGDPLEAGLFAFFSDSSDSQHDEPAPGVPRQLGDYRIVREIGRGGMGIVYLAEQVSLRRSVALKVLPPQMTLVPDAVARFRTEASAVAQLKHPGIVQVHAVGEHAGHHFFAMEFVEGSSLHEVLSSLHGRRGEQLDGTQFGSAVAATTTVTARQSANPTVPRAEPTSSSSTWPRTYVETICRLAVQVADALQHAHDSGVIHRDVKPSNILVREDGSAVLTDFGLARQEDLPHLTQTGVFAGTPHYASPEQANAETASIDHRTDVFSLGATLYELLTLHHPFRGKSSQQVLENIRHMDPRHPRRLNRRVPTDLGTIVMKALEKEPRRRYQRAGDLAADLRAFLANEPITARPASVSTKVLKFARRHRVGSVAAVVIPLLLAAGAVWWSIRPVEVDVTSSMADAILFIDGDDFGPVPTQAVSLARGPHRFAVVKLTPDDAWFDVRDEGIDAEDHGVVLLPRSLREVVEEAQQGHVRPQWLLTNLPDQLRSRHELLVKKALDDLGKRLARSTGDIAGEFRGAADAIGRADPNEWFQARRRAGQLVSDATRRAKNCRESSEELLALLRLGHRTSVEQLEAARATIAALESEEFEDHPFAPAKLAAEAASSALLAAAGHLDYPLEELERRWEFFVSHDLRSPAFDRLERRIREWRVQILFAIYQNSDSRTMDVGLEEVELVDPDEKEDLTQLLRVFRGQTREQERAALLERKLLRDAVDAFGRRDLEALRQTLDAVEEEVLLCHLLGRLEPAEQFLDTYQQSWDSGIEIEEGTALERTLESLVPQLAEKLRPLAENHLARVRQELSLRIAAQDRCRKIDELCHELKLQAAEQVLVQLREAMPEYGFAEALATAHQEVAALDQEWREWRTLQQREAEERGRFLEALQSGDRAQARRLLADLEDRWVKATEWLGRVLAGEPTNAEAPLKRAEFHLRMGEPKLAETDAGRVIEDHPGPPAAAYLIRGQAKYLLSLRNDDPDAHREALQDFERACVPGPFLARALYWRGTCLHDLALHELSSEDEDRARALQDLAHATDRSSLDSADACYQVATILLASGHAKPVRARDYVDLAKKSGMSEDEVLARMGGYRNAVSYLETFRRNLALREGHAYLLMKDFSTSLEHLNAAITLDETFRESYFFRAMARGAVGQSASAKSDLKQARDLVENDPELRKEMEAWVATERWDLQRWVVEWIDKETGASQPPRSMSP